MADLSPPPITDAYAFGMSPEGSPVLAGRLSVARTVGTFTYEPSWLEYAHRYPLDPVNLPLKAGPYRCRHNGRVFPVFSDAAPDAWGTRIMLLQHKSQPRNEIERLLRTSSRGVGSLQFSLSRSRPKDPAPSQDISLIERLSDAVAAIEGATPPEAETLRLVQPGSSMGGARPKVTLHDGDVEYLAKFSKTDDLVDISRVEYATMRMLASTSLDIPKVRLEPVGKGRSAYLIERFDIKQQRTTHHYVSAHALFNIERLRTLPDGHLDPAGYVALTRHLRGHATHFAEDCRQLFLRALTNIALGNTDDHARNFGMRYDLRTREWSLAPVFDVVPIVSSNTQQQAMSLGVGGRESSWTNLLSCCTPFGLNETEAKQLALSHLAIIQNWEEFFRDAGVSGRDIALLRTVITPRMNSVLEKLGGTM